MGVVRKKLKHTVIQKYFFLEILINVKGCRVKNRAPGKCITGAALDRPGLDSDRRKIAPFPKKEVTA
jgi:hypothetical protein